MADAEAAGLFSMVVPTELGGEGFGLDTLVDATRILAHGCPASAWTLSFFAMHSWLLARFDEAARSEFFTPGRPFALTPAPLAPTGTMRHVDGGFRVTGSWEWATGVMHSEWVMVHALVEGPDLATRFVVVPSTDVTIDDVWFTSGMRATGSNTVRLDDVFVPEHRTAAGSDIMVGARRLAGDGLAGLPVAPVLALMAAAPALGAVESAVDHFRGRLSERVLAYTLGERAKDHAGAQIRLGTAMAELAATQALFDRTIEDLTTTAGRGDAATVDQRVAARLAAASTVRAARTIIGAIGEAAGASVYRSEVPFQRLQRDVEVLKGHVIFDWDRTTQLAGRIALGEEPGPTDMV